MSTIYIGIGSNLHNREGNCERALILLDENGIKVKKRSSMIETEPCGIKDQPKFVNMAVEAESDHTPEELLEIIKKIEKDIGREPTLRWGPRSIDLDILFYDDLILNTRELEIPHPHIAERGFVLRPLKEIAPEKIHPIYKKSISELLLLYRQSS